MFGADDDWVLRKSYEYPDQKLREMPCGRLKCNEPHRHRTEVDGIIENFQCKGKATSEVRGGGDISSTPAVQKTTECY